MIHRETPRKGNVLPAGAEAPSRKNSLQNQQKSGLFLAMDVFCQPTKVALRYKILCVYRSAVPRRSGQNVSKISSESKSHILEGWYWCTEVIPHRGEVSHTLPLRFGQLLGVACSPGLSMGLVDLLGGGLPSRRSAGPADPLGAATWLVVILSCSTRLGTRPELRRWDPWEHLQRCILTLIIALAGHFVAVRMRLRYLHELLELESENNV